MLHSSMAFTAPQTLAHASPFAAAADHGEPTTSALESTTSVFCKGLAKSISERQLQSIFSAFGSVVDCQVRPPRHLGVRLL